MHSLESTITICIQSSVNLSILNQPTQNDCEHMPGHSFGVLCGENLPIWRTCFPAGLIVPTITSRDSRNMSNKNNLTPCVCVVNTSRSFGESSKFPLRYPLEKFFPKLLSFFVCLKISIQWSPTKHDPYFC